MSSRPIGSDDYHAKGRLASGKGALGFGERETHPGFVAHHGAISFGSNCVRVSSGLPMSFCAFAKSITRPIDSHRLGDTLQ
ncbi:hypothetical protein ACXR0O_10010 [Verrucomicrobiota bacterium sgz303538]